MKVQVCPQSEQTAERFLCSVLFFQERHKVQYFLLFFRRQVAQFFQELLFDGHGCLSRDLVSLYAHWARVRAIWRGAPNISNGQRVSATPAKFPAGHACTHWGTKPARPRPKALHER